MHAVAGAIPRLCLFDMVINSLWTDMKYGGSLFICHALRTQKQDFVLPRRQPATAFGKFSGHVASRKKCLGEWLSIALVRTIDVKTSVVVLHFSMPQRSEAHTWLWRPCTRRLPNVAPTDDQLRMMLRRYSRGGSEFF